MSNSTDSQEWRKPCEWQRDTFAANALNGIMSKVASTTMPQSSREAIAKLAYQLADAMLVEREKGRLQ